MPSVDVPNGFSSAAFSLALAGIDLASVLF
jgi:hypothetical protein